MNGTRRFMRWPARYAKGLPVDCVIARVAVSFGADEVPVRHARIERPWRASLDTS